MFGKAASRRVWGGGLTACVAVTLAMSGAVPAQAGSSVVLGRDAHPRQTEGQWVRYGTNTPLSTGDVTTRERVPCPPGTTNYTGPAQPYSCLTVFLDQSGHQVGLRQGRSGAGGFGLLHLQIDHNLEERDAELLIQGSPAGISQGNNRFVYGATYRTPAGALVSVEFIEDRNPSTAAPDNHSLGIVTGYCREGDQTAPIENHCPPLPPPFN